MNNQQNIENIQLTPQEKKERINKQKKELKDNNLASQIKRVARRSAQEMMCVSILLSLGYKVRFRKPRLSRKMKPFLLIDRICKDNRTVFNIENHQTPQNFQMNLKTQTTQFSRNSPINSNNSNNSTNSVNQNNSETVDISENDGHSKTDYKEKLTSIIMQELVNILGTNNRITLHTKTRNAKQKNPKFIWIDSVQIDNILYLKDTIFEIGKLMFGIIDDVKRRHESDLEYDFEKFVNVFRDHMEDRLIEFFNVLKMFIPIVPNQQIPSFLPVDMKMNQSDWSIQQNQTILHVKQKQSEDSLRENVVSN